MRPHAQSEEARRKDLLVFVRALGRAESAPRRNPELVKAIRKVIRLYTSPAKRKYVKATVGDVEQAMPGP